jgi:hypothetical protein
MRMSTPPRLIMRQLNNTLPNDEYMDVTFFNYFSTFTLGLMCYSFFNPGFIYEMSIFMAYGFARGMVTGCDLFTTYVYKPYNKYIHKPLMDILNIDNGLYEIEIVRKGRVIHRFKTMDDFVKDNPIEFIYDSDSDSESERNDKVSDSKTETVPEENKTQESNIETPIDADLTNENVNIHESISCNEETEDETENESEEVDTDDTCDNTDSDHDKDNENFILNPRKYDFILRNIYFDDDTLNIPYGFCLKYETFRKSDIKEKYSYDQLKNMLSSRRFIGIHLKTEEKDYIINLTAPVNYYLVDNTILDYSFLKMYLFQRYNAILGNTYKLSCIDNFIEMFTIEQGKKILVKKNMFTIVDDETYNVDSDTDSEYTSESDSDSDSDSGSESKSKSSKENNKSSDDITNDVDIEIVDESNFYPNN